ncbi:MAG TPA: energy transducer TonB, partial [Hyphomonadaceae bacterium]|nr:energy transducer TonB [Hyphomonadaceae bacterium]
LAFEVNASGRVEGVEVLSASMPGVFDNAAIEALEQWEFEEGNPGRGEITIAFQL